MKSRITQNYTQYLHTGKNSIFRVDIHLIAGCNFKCVMCDNWKKKIELNFSDEDILKYIFTLKKYYNCDYIRFHGQEPTMYSKLEELVLFTKKIGIKTAIKTNGWLLNDSRLVKLLTYGLDELYLSIDGPNASVHDAIRGVTGSFDKNVDLIVKGKKINKNLKIYVNSVVLKSNFESLDTMVDFGKKYNVDRISFVFLNDKNTKETDKINLSKDNFYHFIKHQVYIIYKKAKEYHIDVDFSPFFSDLVGKDNDFILNELENNISKYIPEIESMYLGKYGTYFYDKFGCFGPIDHASINYNGDMFGCCVVERSSETSIGNVIQQELQDLWQTEKYIEYRKKSNTHCSYAHKCASNFSTRKNLFKEIYLDDLLYPKNTPISYYRYLKELDNESENIKNNIKLTKLKNILIHFYDLLPFYRKLLIEKGIMRAELENISSLDFVKKLPVLNKEILKEKFHEIEEISHGKEVLKGKTSGTSGNQLSFLYPLDFKRYVRQIAIFSKEFGFTFHDFYFALTPVNCNQVIINNITEPEYVTKVYLLTPNIFNFDRKYFLNVVKQFEENKHIHFLHCDAKYLLYIIWGFEKYGLKLPDLQGISLSYSYSNISLKEYIENAFKCIVADNYGSSETGPISACFNGKKTIFGDNIIAEQVNGKIVVSDFDNTFFPFLRYENGDIGEILGNEIVVYGKDKQLLEGKNLKEIDEFFYTFFPEIITYQFNQNSFLYISKNIVQTDILSAKLQAFFGKEFKVVKIGENDFFDVGTCSKFKTIHL